MNHIGVAHMGAFIAWVIFQRFVPLRKVGPVFLLNLFIQLGEVAIAAEQNDWALCGDFGRPRTVQFENFFLHIVS